VNVSGVTKHRNHKKKEKIEGTEDFLQTRFQLCMKIKEYQTSYSFRRKNEIFDEEIFPLINSKKIRVGKINANNQLQ
jgi:hypothetical protein